MAFLLIFWISPLKKPTPTLAPNRGGPVACIGCPDVETFHERRAHKLHLLAPETEAPMGGNGQKHLCEFLQFFGLFIWRIYLNNRFKSSGILFWSVLANKISIVLCEGPKPPNSTISGFLDLLLMGYLAYFWLIYGLCMAYLWIDRLIYGLSILFSANQN